MPRPPGMLCPFPTRWPPPPLHGCVTASHLCPRASHSALLSLLVTCHDVPVSLGGGCAHAGLALPSHHSPRSSPGWSTHPDTGHPRGPGVRSGARVQVSCRSSWDLSLGPSWMAHRGHVGAGLPEQESGEGGPVTASEDEGRSHGVPGRDEVTGMVTASEPGARRAPPEGLRVCTCARPCVCARVSMC